MSLSRTALASLSLGPSPTTRSPEMKSSKPKRGPQPNILVAEDDSDQILLLQREFKRKRFPAVVRYLRDGSKTIAYLKGEGQYANRKLFPLPDLILLDIKMPKQNGFEVLQAVKADPLLAKIPIVVLTISQELADVNQAYQLGARTFLVKPLDLAELRQLCQTLCPDKTWVCQV